MKSVWRIATVSTKYKATDLSGNGAKISGGRWNPVNVPMVYCSESIALACLETLVHLNSIGLPFNRALIRIDIPEAVFEKAQILRSKKMPELWDSLDLSTSQRYGKLWIESMATAVMAVPSVIVPEETNYVLNPLHADMNLIKASVVRPWSYDSRIKI